MNDNSIKLIKFSKQIHKTLLNSKKKYEIKNTGSIQASGSIQKKIRNPGVDLIRMIAMNGIIINHLIYQGKGFLKFAKYERQLVLLNSFFFWHNNGFTLLSGFVGYKTNKYSNLLYLWLSVVFYSVGIHIFFITFKPKSFIRYKMSMEYFPIIYERYWYFTRYFGMYLFLPVINKGISLLTKVEFKLLIISIIGIFSFWKDYKTPGKDPFKMDRGYTIIWFLCLFLTGAYIGKYRTNYSGIKKFIYCFICLFIYGFVTFLYNKIINNELNFREGYLRKKIIIILKNLLNININSILKVAQSISIILFVLQINFNKYLAKIISFCGPLNFGVYLIHIHTIVDDNIIRNIFEKYSNNLSLISTIILVLKKDIIIYVICICIQYMRYILFYIIRIRKICIILEKLIFKLFS